MITRKSAEEESLSVGVMNFSYMELNKFAPSTFLLFWQQVIAAIITEYRFKMRAII